MNWKELSIEVPGEYAEPVSHLFARHGDGGAVVEMPGGYNPDEGESPPINAPVLVKTFVPDDSAAGSRLTMIEVGLRLIAYLCPLPDLSVRLISDDEWKNQRFEPVRIGRRLVISPVSSVELVTTRPGDVIIPLDPGLAFGTGHHPTTAMVLEAMEDESLEGARILDAGCGSGILSIASVKLGAASVIAFDVEEDAVRSTTRNALEAGVEDSIRVIQGTLPLFDVRSGTFNYVLANISANALISLCKELVSCLAPNGMILASGVLADRFDEVESAFSEAGGVIFGKHVSEDWTFFKIRHK